MVNHRIKKSRQREKILEILKNTDIHPTAEWIFSSLKREMPKLSRGTVYRNLNILLENNQIQEVYTPDANRHFEARLDMHYHFVCKKCASVFDIDDTLPVDMVQHIAAKTGHQIESHTLEFYGICQSCSNQNSIGG